MGSVAAAADPAEELWECVWCYDGWHTPADK
jgi:hypothetical protein